MQKYTEFKVDFYVFVLSVSRQCPDVYVCIVYKRILRCIHDGVLTVRNKMDISTILETFMFKALKIIIKKLKTAIFQYEMKQACLHFFMTTVGPVVYFFCHKIWIWIIFSYDLFTQFLANAEKHQKNAVRKIRNK